MPIYAYKCESCGHSKDVLQKMSDVPLTECPKCGACAFKKQLTAAGFQLKGSGWYATDFKGGAAPVTAEAKPATDALPAKSDNKPGEGAASVPAASASPAASGGCAGSCACH